MIENDEIGSIPRFIEMILSKATESNSDKKERDPYSTSKTRSIEVTPEED